jgi:hypothetical protein
MLLENILLYFSFQTYKSPVVQAILQIYVYIKLNSN